MSTKTTFKRVALVTVAALGFGLLSTVPSGAATQADSLSITSATATMQTGETLTAGSATATLSFLGGLTSDSMSVTAFLVSAPAGNAAIPMLSISDTTSAYTSATAPVAKTAYNTVLGQVAFVAPATALVSNSASWKVFLADATDSTGKTAAVKAGTYVISLQPAVTAGGGVKNSSAVTLTITVTTNPKLDTVAASATVILNKGETSSATADDTVTNSKTASITTAAATISVALLNAAAVATVGESYTATVSSGPGILGSGANTGPVISGPSATGRAITVKAGDVVQLFPDGASGVSTVTISSALGVVLATKKVTFYGATTKLTATVIKPVIGAVATAGTILVTAADSAGTEVQDAVVNVFSSTTATASNSYTPCAGYTAATTTVGAGYLCSVTGVAAGTVTITPTTLTSATDTTVGAVSGTGVSIRVGSTTPASVSVTTDKASYIPGEKATITITLLDSTGLALADGNYSAIFATGGIATDYTLGNGSDTLTDTVIRGFASGVKTYTVFMPISESTVKFSWTTGSTAAAAGTGLATANQAVAGSVSVAVVSSSGSAATDAANEATDAANAATDAANAAAEAADAATAAAQDAADAVATLSTQVAELISALKAQITSLTNLVIKIQKKVKA
jgi:hypothetical protein